MSVKNTEVGASLSLQNIQGVFGQNILLVASNNNVVVFYTFITQREVQSFSKNECFVYKFPLPFFSYCTVLSAASAST